ncbi:MAG: DUF4465 domain-containing protein [Tannerella sp.]|jgi:hypothetical protein|nr:DUF4465 domain-containing protein [Tannerella sp.]
MKRRILPSILGFVVLAHIASAQQTVTLDLSRPVQPAELTLDPEKGYWTEAFSDAPLVFEHFTFPHEGGMYGTSGYWSGFIVGSNGDSTDYGSPNSTSTEGWLVNQWGNMAGGGIRTKEDGGVLKDGNGKVLTKDSIPYLIAFGDYGVTLDETSEAIGVYLNSHPWPYYSNLYGDPFARALDQEGDYYKVIISGRNEADEETGKVEYLFAEYKDGKLRQSKEWEWVDLSPLGKINRLMFQLTSTDTGEWGMNTPAYFCMDKLQVKTSGSNGIVLPVVASARAFPNPADDRLIITGTAIRDVTVHDLSGRTVYRLPADNSPSELIIPVFHWAKGIYMIRITDSTGTSSHKIIKR